jgi:mannosyltransferase
VNRLSQTGVRELASRLHQPRVAVPLLLVVAVALRLPNLDESLWYDEVAYSIHDRWLQVWEFVKADTAAPLYPLLMYFWDSLTADHEWLVRFPSLVLGVGSIGLTYMIARRFGTGATALLTGLMLAFSPVHIWYSQEGTPYAMTMFWLLAAVFAWPRASTASSSPIWYGVYLVSLLAAVFTQYFATLFLLPFTLLALRADKAVRTKFLVGHAIVVLSVSGWLVAQYSRGSLAGGGGFLRPFTIFEWWMLLFQWFLHGNSISTVSPYSATPEYVLGHPGLLGLQLMFAAIFTWGLWPWRAKETSTPTTELMLYLCAMPIAMLVASAFGYSIFIERYLLILLPFFAIAVARGATRFSNPRIRGALTCAVVVAAITAWASFLSKGSEWTVYKQNPDWQGAAEYLSSQNLVRDQVLFLGTVPLLDFQYHLLKRVPAPMDVRFYDGATLDRVSAEGHPKEIVLVENKFWEGNFNRALETFMRDPRVRSTSVRSFKGVALYTFVLVKSGTLK